MKTLPTAHPATKVVSGSGTATAPTTPLATATVPTATTATGSGFDPNNLPVAVGTNVGVTGLTGVIPIAATGVNSLTGMLGAPGYGYGAGIGSSASGQPPQVNATNQSALAPNGDVTQNVTNNNVYHNDIYIQNPNGSYSAYNPYLAAVSGGSYGAGLLGSCQSYGTGISGWFERLFQGL